MQKIDIQQLKVIPFQLLDQQWALLVAGRDKPNPMTVSWGGFGTLWHLPMLTVYVRPTRYTYNLLNEHPECTLNFMPAKLKRALELCGSKSGRDMDKWEAAGLSQKPSAKIDVPQVAGAELSFECRVRSWENFHPSHFINKDLKKNYARRDYHRIYFAEVLQIWGKKRFIE